MKRAVVCLRRLRIDVKRLRVEPLREVDDLRLAHRHRSEHADVADVEVVPVAHRC
jgi:hypothetical protein